jgi:diaminopimelate decarboxylase
MANLVSTIARRFYRISDGELFVDAHSARSLAHQFGTPIFVYSRRVVDEKLEALNRALPPCFEVFYSIKANPNISLLQHFLSRGCGLEIASAGEFHLALEAGCDPKQMLFAGPGKTESELELALSYGFGEIHVESLTEIDRIARISSRRHLTANISIRVNPSSDAEGGAMRMGGRSTPFGIDEEMLDDVVDRVLRISQISLSGIHIFSGTQILNAHTLVTQYRRGLEIAKRVAEQIGRPLRTIDFGGGLGIPYFENDRELNLDDLGPDLTVLFAEIANHDLFRETRFVIEPGRFLVGEAGIYLARVNDIKVSRGKKFLILDGGMNHHLAASGNLGQTIKRNFPVALVNKMDAAAEETVDVVGPLCTPLDTVARSVALPHAEIGDLFGIFQSGAYARSASPLNFLSHPPPAEVWIDGERSVRIRASGEPVENDQRPSSPKQMARTMIGIREG